MCSFLGSLEQLVTTSALVVLFIPVVLLSYVVLRLIPKTVIKGVRWTIVTSLTIALLFDLILLLGSFLFTCVAGPWMSIV